AFFVIGHKADAHPELVRAIVAGGHVVGVHGYAHERLFALRGRRRVRRDLERAVASLERITGVRPVLFRPPIGHVSPAIAAIARELDLRAVGWSVRGVDGWRGARSERVAARVARRLRNGAIVLLHDGAERGTHEPAGVRALPAILETARRNGLGFVRVDAWLSD
ncbi:MAG: polysaccharide deacetylase family protein, partial [Polyangiaceae bacterium]|nr:polysaccharide deacetylase family protein [Polyangiaceae bacterium]